MPEISEISKHVMIEETKEGLNIEIVDQDGRSMFPEGSKEPYERTRRLVQRIAGPLSAAAAIACPSSATRRRATAAAPGLWTWDLSADRANAVRQILEEEGVPRRISSWWRAGRHPTAVSGRSFHGVQPPVTITLMREAPPFRANLSPEPAPEKITMRERCGGAPRRCNPRRGV